MFDHSINACLPGFSGSALFQRRDIDFKYSLDTAQLNTGHAPLIEVPSIPLFAKGTEIPIPMNLCEVEFVFGDSTISTSCTTLTRIGGR
jgi:hypothetical protein